MKQFVLKLYIAGRTARTEQAISSLKEICEKDLASAYELAVIDVLERPQLAENEKILVTPTLVKELPPPLRRVVGDLSDRERVLVGLDLAVCKHTELGDERSDQ
jgi:circadian clock protein KaiB